MVSNPTADDILRVRYRLNTVGDTTNVLSDDKITVFWREVVAEIEMECNVTFNTDNELHLATAADGTAAMVLTDLIGRAFEATSIELGDLRIDEQGLNWNVGVFQAAQNTLYRRYEHRKMMITQLGYNVSNTGAKKIGIAYSLKRVGK